MERMQMESSLATPADAEIILKLYDLRREELMRKARAWVIGNSGRPPRTNTSHVAMNPADPHNAYMRQVIRLLGDGRGLVLHGPSPLSCLSTATPKASSSSPSSSRSSTAYASGIPCSSPAPPKWSSASPPPPPVTRSSRRTSKACETGCKRRRLKTHLRQGRNCRALIPPGQHIGNPVYLPSRPSV